MKIADDTRNGAPPSMRPRDSDVDGMIELDDAFAPLAPASLDATGIEPEVLENLALKLAFTVPRFTTQWAAERLCLPVTLVGELLHHLRVDHLLDMLGQSGPFNHQFAVTGRGVERAQRLLEISGYIGPAPVSLESYSANLEQQCRRLPAPRPEDISSAVADMVLPDATLEVAGLAMLARRSLFLYGPPGNGKTCLGHLLHDAVEGVLWIPHCIGVGENIIRVFDPECHRQCDPALPAEAQRRVDRRWVSIKRPFIVVGGELTVESLDLTYAESRGYYEAPLHFKANGGTFLLDDFGCQRVAPNQLLNRWIHPLERHVDFLTLQTGQQIEVPFRQMLIVSTNLNPDDVMTPAFLRRLGYRVHLDNPGAQQYTRIFRRYAGRLFAAVPEGLIEYLLDKYRAEGRPLRGCEPRDLIERARDICRYHRRPLELSRDVLDLAWHGYFGNGSQQQQEAS